MERFFKSNKLSSVSRDTVILVDNPGWRNPQTITLDVLNETLQFNAVDMAYFIDHQTLVLDPSTLKIKIDESFQNHSSVTRVTFDDQHINPNLPPDTSRVDTALHLATDSNYLYIWVEDSKRWKRIPMSEF